MPLPRVIGGPAHGDAHLDITEDLAEAFDLEVAEGVLVAEVSDGSPAAVAGRRSGMFISQVNRQSVDDVEAVEEALAAGIAGIFFARNIKQMRAGSSLRTWENLSVLIGESTCQPMSMLVAIVTGASQ